MKCDISNNEKQSLKSYTVIRTLSSSYPVYPAHKKLWSGSKEEKTAAIHTHKEERGEKSPQPVYENKE